MASHNSGSNTSKPLTGPERSEIFQYGMRDITGSVNNPVFDINYQSPGYVQPAAYQGLSNGDYNALQGSLYTSATAGLDKYRQDTLDHINQDASNRGIWSSGIPISSEIDLAENLAPAYVQAGAGAASQRYGLQAQDLANQNSWNQSNNQFLNQFNTQQAAQDYASQWAPLEYLQGLYNQTGGIISNQKESGWGFL